MSRFPSAVRRATVPAPSHAHTPRTTTERPAGWTPLGELLVADGVIGREALAEALLKQQHEGGARIGEMLVSAGTVNERQVAEALAAQHDLALADLSGEQPEADALAYLAEPVARKQCAVPIRVVDGRLVVAVSDPSTDVIAAVQAATRLPLTVLVAPVDEVRRTIDRSYRALEGIESQVDAFRKSAARQRSTSTPTSTSDALVDNAPVVQIVTKVITQALRDRASDIHLEPQGEVLRVRFRIDGALHDVLTLPGELAGGIVSRLKIMAGMNIVERRRPQDGQVALEIDGRDIDIRVATTGTIWGEKTVLRLLDKSRSLYRLGDLGMPEATHAELSRMIHAPFGMVLCAGPTGSGKTTSLYAALDEINEPHRNIMTIEDPVEYVIPSINQIQTNEQAGLTFATGLKSILRQDPDVILVGEIRDVETARIATQSALTGHFVLSSLHATDAVAALHRFLDMGIESFLIASSVLGVVGQRLVRRTCTYCRRPTRLTTEERGFLVEAGVVPKARYYSGEGCSFCSGTGYSDRIGVYELLKLTPEIKRLVVGWATQDELRKTAIKQGMRTLRDEAVALVQSDVTTVFEVLRTVYAI
jgi:type IV pilus assembly protein PilB